MTGFWALLRGELSRWIGRRGLLHLIGWTLLIQGQLYVSIATGWDSYSAFWGFDLVVNLLWLFPPLGAIAVAQGAMAEERGWNTLGWVMARPVTRTSFVTSKVVGTAVPLILLAVVTQGVIAYVWVPDVQPERGEGQNEGADWRSCSPTSRRARGGGRSSPTRCSTSSNATMRCSTRVVNDHGRRCIPLLRRRHDRVVRAAHRCPRAAVRAQREIDDTDWSAVGGLAVRMCVHVGDVVLRDGEPFGWALNFGSRLNSIGHGGQILLSAAAVEALGDELHAETTIESLGRHRLRDIVQPAEVHQLWRPASPSEFPPLRGTVRPVALVEQPHRLIGRETTWPTW
jgi:class 3 adenylate cyclase